MGRRQEEREVWGYGGCGEGRSGEGGDEGFGCGGEGERREVGCV